MNVMGKSRSPPSFVTVASKGHIRDQWSTKQPFPDSFS